MTLFKTLFVFYWVNQDCVPIKQDNMDNKSSKIYDEKFDSILSIVVKKALGVHKLDFAEQELFDAWYNQDKKNQNIFNSLGKDAKIDELLTLLDSDFAKRQLKGVKKRIAEREVVQTRRYKIRKPLWYSIAASVAIVLALVINQRINMQNKNKMVSQELSSVYMVDSEGGQPVLIEEESISFKPSDYRESRENELEGASSKELIRDKEAIRITTVVVPKGKEVNIVLPDGSHVWLGANSTISFPEKFSGDTREVTISGEAYFEVVNDGHSRFVTISSNIKTIVYGTEFYITSLEEANYTSVSLLSGSVEVESHTGVTAMLVPGKRAVNTKGEGDFELQDFNVENLRAVKDGMFVFWGYKIKDIIPVLNNWYNFTLGCDKEIENSIFYLKIDKNAPIEEVLKLLASTNRLGFTINTKEKYIKLTTSN